MPTPQERIAIIQAAVGHTFVNPELVIQSTTHPSVVEADPDLSYERLEFLGDAIIGFVIAKYAYERYPHLPEGDLTKMRIAVVNGHALADRSEILGLGQAIEFGVSEPRSGSRGLHSALADVFEAVTAALYLDAGFDVAERWIIDNLGDHVSPDYATTTSNPKADLQERVQAVGRSVEYRIVGSSGPAHQPTFTSQVVIEGTCLGTGVGASKRQAEAAAAEEALARIEAEGAW